MNAEPAFLETFPESVVKATISVSELLGSGISFVLPSWLTNEFVAKVDARDYLQKVEQVLNLDFDLNKAHFFDVETERQFTNLQCL